MDLRYLAEAHAALAACCDGAVARAWLVRLAAAAAQALGADARLPGWQQALAALPPLAIAATDLVDGVRATAAAPLPAADAAVLRAALLVFAPWRKGPFEIAGVLVDAEWRSDLKWARVTPHLAPLAGRRVLDVGCGNAYYAWRMAGAGAALVVGIDPALACLAQFLALRRYLGRSAVHVLPLTSAALDVDLGLFDTVFSMGVLYHRREPRPHLAELRRALRPGGELVLETLVVAAAGATVLVPAGRYARMRNVSVIPSCATVEAWLAASGFSAIRCVDVSATTSVEQRRTAWMKQHSLADFLDPSDHTRTIEGHPAPLRAVFMARAQ